MSSTTTKKRNKLKAKKEYDEDLMEMNSNIRAQVLKQVGEGFTPKCPVCKSVRSHKKGMRKGVVVGEKPYYKCLECGASYSEDDSRYRNVYLELQALKLIHINGAEQADFAIKMIKDYGVNTENMTIIRLLQKIKNDGR